MAPIPGRLITEATNVKRKSSCMILPIFFFVAECASTSTQTVNDNGQVANCGAWEFGIIGAPAALISTQNCISKYQASGFHEAGLPQVATGTQTAERTGNSLPAGPITITSKDGS